MESLNQNDVALMENLALLKQEQILSSLKKLFKKHYKKVISAKEYLIAEGNIPIVLLAHADTVMEQGRDIQIIYDKETGYMTALCPTFDDRAGIFLILKILQSGLRPHIIITTDEEMGCLGAEKLIKKFPKCPFNNIKYLVQLDRRGEDDCVFYSCENKEFRKYVETFGFITDFGSFTDISVIAPAWGIAAVNLSVGYYNEHSYCEVLHVPAMLKTLHRVTNMLREAETAKFYKYIAKKRNWKPKKKTCNYCGKHFEDFELIPVVEDEGTYYFCPDCCATHVDWCKSCGQPHLTKKMENGYCEECLGRVENNV